MRAGQAWCAGKAETDADAAQTLPHLSRRRTLLPPSSACTPASRLPGSRPRSPPLASGATSRKKARISATWAWPTPPWATRAAPSSTTSSTWPSPARSATGGGGHALGNLGIAYADLGEPRRAIEYYEQASGHRPRDRRPAGGGQRPGQPGQRLRRPGRARRAIEYYEQQLAIAREIGDRRGEGIALNNIGMPTTCLGIFSEPSPVAMQVLAISREIGDPRHIGCTLNNWPAPTATWRPRPRPAPL